MGYFGSKRKLVTKPTVPAEPIEPMAIAPEPEVTEPIADVTVATKLPDSETLQPLPAAEPTAAQQAAIDKIMEDARAAAQQVLLQSPGDTLGTPSGDIEDRQTRYQRDFLPGKIRRDKTYVPERIYDEETGVERRVLLKSDYHYVLVDGETVDSYMLAGWRVCLFDGGGGSGLADRGFRGTGDSIFRRDIYGRCQRGDVFLMYISHRGWQALAQEDVDAESQKRAMAVGDFANDAYRAGIRPWVKIDGQQLT